MQHFYGTSANHLKKPVERMVGHSFRHWRHRPAAHSRMHPDCLPPVESEIFLTAGHVGDIRLDADSFRLGNGAEIPVGVVGPEGTHFHDRGAGAAVLHNVVEQQFLLWLVVAAQFADDPRHPLPLVTPGANQRAFVHHLHITPVMADDHPGVGSLGDRRGVAAADRHRCPAGCWIRRRFLWQRLATRTKQRLKPIDHGSSESMQRAPRRDGVNSGEAMPHQLQYTRPTTPPGIIPNAL